MTTEEHPNVAKARAGFEAFGRGDIDAASRMFADDIVWHQPGRGPLAGNHHGPGEVLAFFAKLQEETNGTFRTGIHDIVGNDEHVVALLHATAERNGKRLDQNLINVFHVNSEGKVTERWLFPEDAAALDEFWS